MPRYVRGVLPAGHVVSGPALVEDAWSTSLVDPGQRCRADRLGNLIIEVDEGRRPS
jgi:N-methylhydantoinase A